MRGRRVSLGVVVLGLSPSVQAFVAPSVPEAPSAKRVPLSAPAVKRSSDGSSSSSSSSRRSSSGSAVGMSRRRAALAASPSVLKMSEEDEAAEEYEGPAAEVEVVTTDSRKDAGVLAATGATGAIVGWSLGHSLGLDMMGMFAGCLAAVGLLAQEGTVGETAAKFGAFALGAFEVVGTVASSTNVPAKVASSVGEEFLEVVEFTSSAVTKGYMDSLPEPVVRYEAQIARSKETAAELKGQLDKVSAAFAEAKEQLKQRAENQRIVDAAKTTVAELAVAKAAVVEKDAAIAKSLQLARREKDAFDVDLKAAKAEAGRFRDMVETRADMDDNYRALAEASDTLEERVQDYEARLRVLSEENDGIRADYSAEIKSMEAERSSMRERIASLESALTSSETAIDQQRADLQAELLKMGNALDEKSAAAEAAAGLAAEMKAALQASIEEKADAVGRAAEQMKAAQEARSAAEEEKARAALEVKAAKEQAMKAAAEAARAEGAAAKAKAVTPASAPAGAGGGAGAAAGAKKRQPKKKTARQAALEAKERKASEEAEAKKAQAAAAAEREAQKMKDIEAKKKIATAGAAASAAKPPPPPPHAGHQAAPAKKTTRARGRAAGPATSKAKTTAGAAAAAAAAAGEGGGLSKEGLMKMTVKDLRERCKAAGVPTSGRKADIVDRLLDAGLVAS